MDGDGVSVEADMRGKHHNKPRNLLSHYRRAQMVKRYVESHESMQKMWLEFIAKNPSFKTKRSDRNNRGPVISYSTFRNIFKDDLRVLFSFRRSREDTCQAVTNSEKNRSHRS